MGRGMRQIHMDAPVCRYSELGVNPSSTEVHLWISEHKSARPWMTTGFWNDPG